MTDDQQSQGGTQAEQDESIFFVRMIWIIDQEGIFIVEDGFGLNKGHSMFTLIEAIFCRVPSESEFSHIINIV